MKTKDQELNALVQELETEMRRAGRRLGARSSKFEAYRKEAFADYNRKVAVVGEKWVRIERTARLAA